MSRSVLADNPRLVYRRLLSHVWPYRHAFLLAIVGNILYGIVDAGMIAFLKPLLDEGFVNHNMAFIQWIPMMVIGIFVLRGMATFLSTYFMGWVGRQVVMNFRQAMFAQVLKLPTAYFDKTSSGEILSKITFNVEQVANASTDAFTVMIRETCTAIALIAVMLTISWRLTLLFVVVVPMMAAIMHVVSRRMRLVSSRVQDSMGGVTHVAEEAIEGQKVIKAFGGQAYEIQQFDKATQHNRRQEMKMIVTSAVSIPMIQFVGSFALAATIYLATLEPTHALSSAISPGAFAAMMTAMISLLKPLKQLTKVNSNIQKGIAGAASIFDFLDEKPEPDTGSQVLTAPKGNVRFHKVCFSYHSEGQTLENISFDVKAGETVALVGRSGGGKSTLVNLLPRFYESSGEILIDGISVSDLSLKSLREQIAIVSQQVILFNDTVAKNIAYGCENASKEAIIAAATSAHARDFIEGLPQGFDTMVGENGVRLSGGQRQRIAIARAILKKAPILILDEATSALDTESERHIQAALDQLMGQCTTLVIAHRLSTIENADRIVVIDQGKIVEMGTHQALIAADGIYAQLRAMQYAQSENRIIAPKEKAEAQPA
jgi:subfamily B ATP-binding cassette protein MsbA